MSSECRGCRGASDLGLTAPLSIFVNNRGIAFPKAIFGDGMWAVLAAFVLAIIAVVVMSRWAARRQAATGQIFPIIRAGIAVIIGLPILAFLAAGMPLTFDVAAGTMTGPGSGLAVGGATLTATPCAAFTTIAV